MPIHRTALTSVLALLLVTGCSKEPAEKQETSKPTPTPPAASAPATPTPAPATPTGAPPAEPQQTSTPSLMEQAKQKAGAMAEQAKQAAEEMADQAGQAADEGMAAAKEAAQPVVDEVAAGAEHVMDQAREGGKSALEDTAAAMGQVGAALQGMAATLENPALIKQGARVANKCKACHDLAETRKNRVGPYLYGIVGQPAAQVTGFKFSAAHRQAAQEKGIVWTAGNLDTYLANPKAYIPGNRMAFAGISDPAERKALIAYLSSLK